MDDLLIYTKMYHIRMFEETLLRLFSENKLSGTTHTSIGQEAVAVAAMAAVDPGDFVFSNHRCHGHFLAYCGRSDLLFAEIMGKSIGMCGGRGGSQHICYRNFYSNGVQGGIVANATGMAFAEKIKETANIGFVFLGDGTLGQGIVYESINIASLWDVPIVYIVENNQYAMSTKAEDAIAGSIEDRFKAFGIKTAHCSSDDARVLTDAFQMAANYVRTEKKPFCQIVDTYRLSPHSKGDDFRDPNEVQEWREKDPLKKQREKCDLSKAEDIEKRIIDRIKQEVNMAEGSPSDELNRLGEMDVKKSAQSMISCSNNTLLIGIQKGLRRVMDMYQQVYILGEDVCDPYGGAFKVTKGLSTQYPNRVINTPISEAGIIGVGTGMALNGLLPIIEIMFGDFISLGFDQILNHATKYNWMYAGQKSVPLLIRTPMGGGRGYGATHSQSLEKFFVGIPNLHVIALNLLHDPESLLLQIYDCITSPVLFIEDKRSYGMKQLKAENGKVGDFYVKEENAVFPAFHLSMDTDNRADAVILTYGANLSSAMQSAQELLVEEEIQVDIIVFTSLSSQVSSSDFARQVVRDVPVIITLEEGTITNGWGSEIIAGFVCAGTKGRYCRIATPDTALPCGTTLEKRILPSVEGIKTKILEMIS